MDLRYEKVKLRSRKIKQIYKTSFPKEERMPFWLMVIMSKMKNTDFISFNEGKNTVGFAYLATVGSITFIMFLAVDKTLRSKGYGSDILNKIESMYPNNKIILSVERCDGGAKNIEQKLRRKNFYLKNGYKEAGYMIELSKVKQEVLIKNGGFDEHEFYAFFRKYSNGSMKPKIFKAS